MSVLSKVMPIGTRAGVTLYYAWPKQNQHMTNDEVIEHIVDATSLARGDVKNALISLSDIVKEALQRGSSVDLAELGSLKTVVTSKYMDTEEDVTVRKALKTPKIQFTPKSDMLAAAKSVSISISHSSGSVSTGTVSGSDSSGAGSSGAGSGSGADQGGD
ncbi:MAG: HU family DNA-binding protein [Prevotellaceae bacterium]|nr:HU family DNA-binding protein [Prevotellaceae bacterium]